MLRRLLIVLVIVGPAAGIGWHVSHRELPRFHSGSDNVSRGVFHVHSEASHDSELTLEEIAETARTRGLDFVILTDHNAQLAAPITLSGVTLLSYAELSTPFGHLIQLGAPMLLQKGEREKIDLHHKVRAAGGVPILAHPGDRKRPWDGPMDGVGGLEIANLAASTRRRAGALFVGVVPALLVWKVYPHLAMAQLYDRDRAALAQWDGESNPAVIGLCGNDAHGRIDLSTNLAGWEITMPDRLPESQDERSAAIMTAIEAGRFFCSAAIFGRPRFEFFGNGRGNSHARAGDTMSSADVEELVAFGPELSGGRIATLVLLRNGEEIMRTHADRLRYLHPQPGTYRVEVRVDIPNVLLGARPTPVLYSNKIRVAPPPAAHEPADGEGDPSVHGQPTTTP